MAKQKPSKIYLDDEDVRKLFDIFYVIKHLPCDCKDPRPSRTEFCRNCKVADEAVRIEQNIIDQKYGT